jgi:hypothetical protein
VRKHALVPQEEVPGDLEVFRVGIFDLADPFSPTNGSTLGGSLIATQFIDATPLLEQLLGRNPNLGQIPSNEAAVADNPRSPQTTRWANRPGEDVSW